MKLIAILFLLVGSVNAHALEFGILGGMNMLTQTYTAGPAAQSGITVTPGSGTGYQGGIFVGHHLSSSFSLDVGLNYSMPQSKLTVSSSGITADLTSKSKRIQVPVFFRYWFASMLNLGVGGYYSTNLSDPTATSSNPLVTVSGSSSKKTDYGAAASVQIRLPLSPLSHFIIDGRYLMGLAETSSDTSQNSSKNKEMDVLAGISFGF